MRLGRRARVLGLLRVVQYAGGQVSEYTIMLDGATESDEVEADIGGGSLVAYTVRSPDKTSDNEDTVAAIPYGPDAVVLVVADGAGGLPGGRRASRTAVQSLQDSLDVAMSETMLLRTAILDGIEAANEAVRALGNGSATTLTVVTVEGHTARSYQVGDSEAMVVGQRGRIRAQTMAHSPTGFAIEAGMLDQRAALHHEERHLVSNFIGTADMRIDMGTGIRLNPRDTILLASDGLTDNVHSHEVTELIRKGPLCDAVKSMVGLAKRRMTVETMHQPSKPDDLSVILFRKPYRKVRASAAAGQ
jgi:serine/threonine protein phosphatase PrpC